MKVCTQCALVCTLCARWCAQDVKAMSTLGKQCARNEKLISTLKNKLSIDVHFCQVLCTLKSLFRPGPARPGPARLDSGCGRPRSRCSLKTSVLIPRRACPSSCPALPVPGGPVPPGPAPPAGFPHDVINVLLCGGGVGGRPAAATGTNRPTAAAGARRRRRQSRRRVPWTPASPPKRPFENF
jgi:hypothetical protein